MSDNDLFIPFVLFMFVCVAFLAKLSYSWAVEKKAAKYWYEEYTKKVSEEDALIKQSVKRSLDTQRAVVKGQVAEQMFPILMNLFYGYELADFKFIGGDPIDVVFFPGLSKGNVHAVIFGDIKTGAAKLTKTQEVIKYLINSLNSPYVKWQTFRISDDGYVSVEE
jgi:predicted Holliday junction resolvase-like endonuclease